MRCAVGTWAAVLPAMRDQVDSFRRAGTIADISGNENSVSGGVCSKCGIIIFVESADSVEFELADTGRPIGFPTGTHQVRDQHDRGCHRSRYRRCNNRIHWRRPVDNTLSFQFDSEHWEYNVGDDYNMFVIGDNGRSLTITTNSDNIDIAVCVLHELDMPNSVQSKMGHTRPLDGTQTDKWDGITATWTYSDDELTVILEY